MAERAERVDHESQASWVFDQRELNDSLLSAFQLFMQGFHVVEQIGLLFSTHHPPHFVEDLLELAIIVLQEQLVSLPELRKSKFPDYVCCATPRSEARSRSPSAARPRLGNFIGRLYLIECVERNNRRECKQGQYKRVAANNFFTDGHIVPFHSFNFLSS